MKSKYASHVEIFESQDFVLQINKLYTNTLHKEKNVA